MLCATDSYWLKVESPDRKPNFFELKVYFQKMLLNHIEHFFFIYTYITDDRVMKFTLD